MKPTFGRLRYWLVPTMCSASVDALDLMSPIMSGYFSIMGGSASTGTEDTLLLIEISKLGTFLGSMVSPLAFARTYVFQQAVRRTRNWRIFSLPFVPAISVYQSRKV